MCGGPSRPPFTGRPDKARLTNGNLATRLWKGLVWRRTNARGIIVFVQGRPDARGSRHLTFAGLLIYALFLVTVPFAHHDLICHLKHPAHCKACTSSVLGADPDTPATLGAWTLAEAGPAVTFHTTPDSALLAVRSTGRSPPAQA